MTLRRRTSVALLLVAAAAAVVLWSLAASRDDATNTPASVRPWPIGAGPRYQPAAVSARVAAGMPIGRMRCGKGGRGLLVHVELFANRKVIVIPAGIGVSPHGCRYPVRTTVPTGVIQVDANGSFQLRDLFAVWGRTLRADRLLSFRGRVSVFVDGDRFDGDPQELPLTEHAQIVVEVGGYVAPHAHYVFPKGDVLG